jgi:hypothetical protein
MTCEEQFLLVRDELVEIKRLQKHMLTVLLNLTHGMASTADVARAAYERRALNNQQETT